MKAVLVSSYFFPSMGFLMAIGAIVLWAYGGYEVIVSRSIQPGELMAFIGYTWMLYNPIQALTHSSEQLQGAVTAAERLFEIVDTEPEVEEDEENVKLPEIKGTIEFRNVSFFYEKGDPVLKDINVTIEPGEMIGLVGSSGSGKTTMINLISRFYKVSEGQIAHRRRRHQRIDLSRTGNRSVLCCKSLSSSTGRSRKTSPTAGPMLPLKRSWKRRSWPTPTGLS